MPRRKVSSAKDSANDTPTCDPCGGVEMEQRGENTYRCPNCGDVKNLNEEAP